MLHCLQAVLWFPMHCNQCKTILLFHVNVVNGHAASSHPSACNHIDARTKHLNRRPKILSSPLISHRHKCLCPPKA